MSSAETIESRPVPEVPVSYRLEVTPLCRKLGLVPTPHPLLPWVSDEDIRAILRLEGGEHELAAIYQEREDIIRRSESDAWNHGFQLAHWADVDALLRDERFMTVYVAGGIRASKSEKAARTLVDVAVTYDNAILWALQDNRDSSIENQQKHVWKFLPPELKLLNKKTGGKAHIRYDAMNGFSSGSSNNAGKIVLPNGSIIIFLTYNQDPEDYQGGEIGVKEVEYLKHPAGPPNIGAWPDENLTWKWYETLKGRAATRAAKILWTYSPRFGITQTIKELIDGAVTIKSRFAELLAERINVPGLPMGHMPYVSLNETKETAIVYFHGDLNPFGNWPRISKDIRHTPAQNIMERGYGYTLRTKGRCFPKCSEVNLVKPEHLPATGTNYMITDPAGKRNYATVWVRVTGGREPSFYFYREWPDKKRYGEWAVPSTKETRKDGEPGPAQQTLGWGVLQYKKLWKRLETIRPGTFEKDPLRRKLQPSEASAKEGDPIREPIRMRLVDPRAGRNQHIAEKGGTSVIDLFLKVQKSGDGSIEGERVMLHPASGVEEEEGIQAINELLNWDEEQELVAGINAPRLYISTECENLFWCLMNYTGTDGQTAASKDFIDLVRYAVMSHLRDYNGFQMQTKAPLPTY